MYVESLKSCGFHRLPESSQPLSHSVFSRTRLQWALIHHHQMSRTPCQGFKWVYHIAHYPRLLIPMWCAIPLYDQMGAYFIHVQSSVCDVLYMIKWVCILSYMQSSSLCPYIMYKSLIWSDGYVFYLICSPVPQSLCDVQVLLLPRSRHSHHSQLHHSALRRPPDISTLHGHTLGSVS